MKSRLVVFRPSALSLLAVLAATLIGLALPAGAWAAEHLGVRVSTDRGDDGVYNPGDPLEISTRVTGDAYLLVYEIDAEGEVHVLFPFERGEAYVEGPATVNLPTGDSDYQLVVEGPVGEGYIVAIASREPFEDLPWYLRPADQKAEELGYHGETDGDEVEGVTAEVRIVGDPFVAMERIRRKVLADPSDRESFATDYTSYYVHQAVRYPRYLCYDCHRPGQWAWWDGFDPYYASCTAMDFQVNASWWWGPSYWFGQVPYYVFVYRPDCPPRYRRYGGRGAWFSSWDGSRRWANLWGGPLRRYKTPPPPGYISPPSKFDQGGRRRDGRPFMPPGFLASAHGTPRVSPPERGVGGRQRPAVGPVAGSRNDAFFRQSRRSGGITFYPRDRATQGQRGVRVDRPTRTERPWAGYGRPSERLPDARPMRRFEERGRGAESPRYIDRGRERPFTTPRESAPRRVGEIRSSPYVPRSSGPPRESRGWSSPAPDRGQRSSPPSPSVRAPARGLDRPAPSTTAPRQWDGGSRRGR